MVMNWPANAGDTDSVPGLGRSTGAGNGNLLWYSCLENSMDRAWWAVAHRAAKSQAEHGSDGPSETSERKMSLAKSN